jgi:RNA polymerase sigma factor (sigma-70 family)
VSTWRGGLSDVLCVQALADVSDVPADDSDNESFEALFRDMYLASYAVARRIVRNAELAQDVASEALARTLASWGKVARLPYRKAWVLRVTANVSYDMLRKRRDAPVEVRLDDGFVDDLAVRLDLQEVLLSLPRRQREAVTLRYLADLGEHDVAKALSISAGSVKRHLHRGIQALRGQLGDLGWLEAVRER